MLPGGRRPGRFLNRIMAVTLGVNGLQVKGSKIQLLCGKRSVLVSLDKKKAEEDAIFKVIKDGTFFPIFSLRNPARTRIR
jgi:hypothetical protein